MDFKEGHDYQKERYTHNYYEKSMNTRWVLPKISSMDEDTKSQILANDLVRRLSRIDPTRLQDLAEPVINFYNRTPLQDSWGDTCS